MSRKRIEPEVVEEAVPRPEYLIKSIAEQGYSLETSLADLIDNSVSAKASKVEILVDPQNEPFVLFLADDGEGMDEASLRLNMQFPSSSPEAKRKASDLGRFGLGLKTASFAQTRCFTVISRKKGASLYSARTWDVEYLKNGEWSIIVNSEKETEQLLSKYQQLSRTFLNEFKKFTPNTIVVWQGLYKFEEYLEPSNKSAALKKEITEITSEYLSLVFHRFLDKMDPLQIRVNNKLILPFNPFPENQTDLRKVESNQRAFQTENLRIEGYILPSRSLEESKGPSEWALPNKSLMDMEGIYIYRANRIILYGGWNGIIKKAPRLQLARLKVDIGNSVDNLFHLNVAKSSIAIPHELRMAFLRYISLLKEEAEREYHNRGIRSFTGKQKEDKFVLFSRRSTNKGVVLEANEEFPLLSELKSELTSEQNSKLKTLLRLINNAINKIRQVHEVKEFTGVEEKDGMTLGDLELAITALKQGGVSRDQIIDSILPNLGFKYNSLPENIKKILK
jgi:hypothetical protein